MVKSKWIKWPLQAAGYVLSIWLVYWLLFVKLPKQINFGDVRQILHTLSLQEFGFLVLLGLTLMGVLAWTAQATLPKLRFGQALEASAVSQATSVILPSPFDMVVRFKMYLSYGVSLAKSSASVVLAGLARYFALLVLPVAGVVLLLLSSRATGTQLVVGAVALLAGGFGTLLIFRAVSKDGYAEILAKKLQKLVNAGRRILKLAPENGTEKAVKSFFVNSQKVINNHYRSIRLSNAAWACAHAVIFIVAVRICGISASEMSIASLVYITGWMLILNSVPLIPGGIGFSEAILLSTINFPDDYTAAGFASALLIYRIVTWLLPIPLGIVAYSVWHFRPKRTVKAG